MTFSDFIHTPNDEDFNHDEETPSTKDEGNDSTKPRFEDSEDDWKQDDDGYEDRLPVQVAPRTKFVEENGHKQIQEDGDKVPLMRSTTKLLRHTVFHKVLGFITWECITLSHAIRGTNEHLCRSQREDSRGEIENGGEREGHIIVNEPKQRRFCVSEISLEHLTFSDWKNALQNSGPASFSAAFPSSRANGVSPPSLNISVRSTVPDRLAGVLSTLTGLTTPSTVPGSPTTNSTHFSSSTSSININIEHGVLLHNLHLINELDKSDGPPLLTFPGVPTSNQLKPKTSQLSSSSTLRPLEAPESPSISWSTPLVFTLATRVYKLQRLRLPFDGRGSYGGHLIARSLSPASSKLVELVFTFATQVYKLQRVRWPFECSFDSYLPSLPEYTSWRNYGAHLMVRSLSPAVSRLVGLVFTLATWVYKLQMSQSSLDSYSPSLPGYISYRWYGGRLFVRSLSPAVSKLVGLVFTLAPWVYKLQMARSTRIYPRYLGISAAKTTVAVCLFAHCPLQSQGSLDSYSPSLLGYISCKNYGAHLMVRHCPLQSQGSLDSSLPSPPGYISWRNYGAHLMVRSLSPAVSRYTSYKNYGAHLMVRHCPLQSQGLLDSCSHSLPGYKLQTISLRPYWSIVIPSLIITLSSNNNNSPRSAGLLLVQDHHLLALKHHQRTPKNLCVLKQVLMSNCNLAHNQFGNSGYSSAWTSIPGANKDRPSFIADAATTAA
ncbi:hypothetical protein C8J55DRAFT_490281 [Lentinula edodes]|uniref:Uncharacterized protein n=1 Tax=Lentinula lateritia TaxID=40482 RepID=A0A9W9A744_9AGAR|nr:hypothetical protein C8J55DRAFT_490281 [Lentinula edodes]